MHLSKQSLREFQRLYAQEFGKELTDDQCQQVANEFLQTMQVVLGANAGDAAKSPTHP